MEKVFVTRLFLEFLKINKNILLSFTFVKTHVSENNIDMNIIVQTFENDQCARAYPNKLMQKKKSQESSKFFLQVIEVTVTASKWGQNKRLVDIYLHE